MTSVFNELELFVTPIGKAGETRMGPMAGDVPTTFAWSSVTRAVWVNIAPGQRSLALIEEGSSGSSAGSPTATRRLHWVPDRMVPLSLAKTNAIFGKVDEIDGPLMEAMRRHK